MYFRASEYQAEGRSYLQVEDLKMDFSVKSIQMGIQNVHNGNAVIGEYVFFSPVSPENVPFSPQRTP